MVEVGGGRKKGRGGREGEGGRRPLSFGRGEGLRERLTGRR